jgi:hypothetical protein
MSAIQHAEARKLLKIISSALAKHKAPLDYKRAAKALGRDPKTNSRMVAQVCDLLDAAAAFAGVPLLALVMVRESVGQKQINRKAWTGNDVEPGCRDKIIDRSLQHIFTTLILWPYPRHLTHYMVRVIALHGNLPVRRNCLAEIISSALAKHKAPPETTAVEAARRHGLKVLLSLPARPDPLYEHDQHQRRKLTMDLDILREAARLRPTTPGTSDE